MRDWVPLVTGWAPDGTEVSVCRDAAGELWLATSVDGTMHGGTQIPAPFMDQPEAPADLVRRELADLLGQDGEPWPQLSHPALAVWLDGGTLQLALASTGAAPALGRVDGYGGATWLPEFES